MKKDKTESLRVRVNPAMRAKTRLFAKKQDISEAQVVRLAIRFFLQKNTPKNTIEGMK